MAIPIYNPTTGTTQVVTEFTNQSSVSISHSLSHVPRVIITDLSGNVIFGDIQYGSNSVSITFGVSLSGYVYIT